jgi:hypothetical protein
MLSHATTKPFPLQAFVLEHIMTKTTLDHFDKHSVLQDCQHGFRAQKVFKTQLVTFVPELAKAKPSANKQAS